MKISTTSLSPPAKNHEEIEIISIIITASNATITIPIPRDAPLRCGDLDELHRVAAQMESLIRALVNVAEGNHRSEKRSGGGEKNAIVVW